MFMKFLYRYYYTFFLLHKKDVDEGRIRDPAWASTLIQMAAGVGLFIAGVFFTIVYLMDTFEKTRHTWMFNKIWGTFLIMVVPFITLYLLLFHVYKVNKDTGLTPKYRFEVETKTTWAFWAFWMFSVLLPFFMAALKNGLI